MALWSRCRRWGRQADKPPSRRTPNTFDAKRKLLLLVRSAGAPTRGIAHNSAWWLQVRAVEFRVPERWVHSPVFSLIKSSRTRLPSRAGKSPKPSTIIARAPSQVQILFFFFTHGVPKFFLCSKCNTEVCRCSNYIAHTGYQDNKLIGKDINEKVKCGRHSSGPIMMSIEVGSW